MKTYQLYINGQYVDPANGEWFDSIDPYRGEAWAKIPRGVLAEVNSDGFTTTAQPAASAAAHFQATNSSGEFQAVSAATTPTGSCVV
ncbi:acyl-CoA reductase-like NAD-dependent aldehyde dehydrogenase [Bradyrhizobium elkanii]|nr:acyl-CoA reductase-like NAD-dependent aldehyde dehydrogenase [Bradyrhizobium elkanii]MCS3522363.1 acyl-CoA reductase-like NAD-dependent aldehyde dehydrogenase [Bradyrhizobium elkanii]MCS4070017.1 acyl-CoA reductase-like NAD-dependent aldehyde dehydrogenase [Bradyrhizobium elkanii]MCS4076648.1 acyl-CoA reductase-like NAD-dependent aldehyde dehydrogenase [Bradyrhizobium elkanii]MCS4112371.1 acyl-CoA reductase-like NAD-dependent aldehyde dehydrogenase [Bradyrhizobium elkanii]